MSFTTRIERRAPRAGSQHRCQSNRLFNIPGVGWFILVRGETEQFAGIEVHHGLAGPFRDRLAAERFLGEQLHSGGAPPA